MNQDRRPIGEDEGKYGDFAHSIITFICVAIVVIGLALAIKFNPGS